jgi:hypothetical protein
MVHNNESEGRVSVMIQGGLLLDLVYGESESVPGIRNAGVAWR